LFDLIVCGERRRKKGKDKASYLAPCADFVDKSEQNDEEERPKDERVGRKEGNSYLHLPLPLSPLPFLRNNYVPPLGLGQAKFSVTFQSLENYWRISALMKSTEEQHWAAKFLGTTEEQHWAVEKEK